MLVGTGDGGAGFVAAYSGNMNASDASFNMINGTATVGNVHVVFDPDFKGNNLIYLNDESAPAPDETIGTVYRNSPAAATR